MSEPDGRSGNDRTRHQRCPAGETRSPGALARIQGPARPANRSAGGNRPRPQGQPDEPTSAAKTIRAVTWLKSLREGEVYKLELPGAIKTGILSMAARIAPGSSGQMATTVARAHFYQHPARTMKTKGPLPLHVPKERGWSRYW